MDKISLSFFCYSWIISKLSSSCTTSGYCQNTSLCISKEAKSSEEIFESLTISEENPGPPRCNHVRCSECSEGRCVQFCWRGPNDVSAASLTGFYGYLSTGSNPVKSTTFLIKLNKDKWQNTGITDKKKAMFCVSCKYNDGSRCVARGYVWSLPTLNVSGSGSNACSESTFKSDERFSKSQLTSTAMASNASTIISKSPVPLPKEYLPAIVVFGVILGSATFGMIIFFVQRRHKHESYVEKNPTFDENSINDTISLEDDDDDLVSAVTIGQVDLPAPDTPKTFHEDSEDLISAVTVGHVELPV